jgi:hypothetical protein
MPSDTISLEYTGYKSWRFYWCLLHPKECFQIEVPEVDFPPIPPLPDPPYALQQLTTGNAISALLDSVGYVGPDQEGGPDPNGPLGPYIRNVLVGLSVVQLASRLSDTAQAQELQAVAARVLREQIERIASEVG